MPKICYKQDMRWSEKKLDVVSKAIAIITEYKGKGYDLTLRQVYYQFVARDWFPEDWKDPKTGSKNNQKSYDKLGIILGDARMGGLMDWNSLVDRTREMGGNTHWSSPASIVDAVASQYKVDKWQEQDYRPEVWVEKDALEGVIATVCKRLDIPYFSCRGYTSLSTIWENAQRLKSIAAQGFTPVILHLGDLDPSGVDMSRDIEERVSLFMGSYGGRLEFKRLALNEDQVQQYNPPESPAKLSDSRAQAFVAQYGDSSWELDALDPDVIANLISAAVDGYRDEELYEKYRGIEAEERGLLRVCSDKWDSVARYINRTLKGE
jgi:hypothetical protein